MDINSKFKICQEVWFMKNNKPRKGKILGIQFTHTEGTMHSYYGVGKGSTSESIKYSIELHDEKGYEHCCECSIFASKEELCNYVFNQN